MPSSNKQRGTGCPIAFALDHFGDRWSLVILRDLIMKGYETYGQFLESPEGIATNVLADRLKELEDADIVTKARDPDNHRRYLYRLTEKGAELIPVMLEMILWSAKYDPNTTARKQIVTRIKNDRDGLIKELRERALNRD